MNIGNQINKVISSTGKSKGDFAESIGISLARLSNYTNNRRSPDFQTLITISNLYNINMSFFFDENVPMLNEKNKNQSDSILIHKSRLFGLFEQNQNIASKLKKSEKPEGYEFTMQTVNEAINYLKHLEKIKNEENQNAKTLFEEKFYIVQNTYLQKNDFNKIIHNQPLPSIIDTANKAFEYIELLIDTTFYEIILSDADQIYSEFITSTYKPHSLHLISLSAEDKAFMITDKTEKSRKLYEQFEKNGTKKSTD